MSANNDEIQTIYTMICCLGVLIVYIVYNYSQVFIYNNPNIHLKKTFDNASIWLFRYRDNGDAASGTMAIQTLRNTILVAVFIGGSSFSSGFTILQGITASNSTVEKMKAIILASVFFLSFISWAGVCRIASQLGYVVGTLPVHYKNHVEHDKKIECIVNENIENEIKLSHESLDIDCNNEFKEFYEDETMIKNLLLFFSIGFRFLFVAIPFAFVSISPYALLTATVIILVIFYTMDHTTSRIIPKYKSKTKNSD